MSDSIDLEKYKVKILYNAAGWFSEEASDREERVCKKLRSLGYVVIRPRELGIIPPNASDKERSAVVKMDLKAIDRADAVFATTNDNDKGVFIEAGYAIATGKPVIYFGEGFAGKFNLMLAATGSTITKFEDITREFIDKAIEYANQGKIYKSYEGEVE